MKLNISIYAVVTGLFLGLTLGACKKYASEVAAQYRGTLTVDDSLEFSNVSVQLREISKQVVSVSSDYFNDYEVTLGVKRIGITKEYFAVGIEESLTISNDFMILSHDEDGSEYLFIGDKIH